VAELKIEVAGGRVAFDPGEELNGIVKWSGEPAASLELRLFWFTRGKGTEDVGIVENVRFEQPLAEGERSFRFRLPPAPYTCSGRLVSVVWALELIAHPSKAVARQELQMGPHKKAVRLESLPAFRTPGIRLQVER
jgi:hypothetical protein